MTENGKPTEEERRLRRRAEVARETRGGVIERAKRRNRVLELRAAGLTEHQIAEQLGMQQPNVNRTIQRALKQWADKDAANVNQIRQMKLFELDQLKRGLWAKAISGELGAVREAVRIIQLQARLAGAEAPVKVEKHTTVDIGLDSAEIDRMESAWLTSGGDVIDGVVASEEEEASR